MIQMPNDFKDALPYDGSNGPTLTVGGHCCRIRGAKQETARTGTQMLSVAFDIFEGGEFDGYYGARYDRNVKYNSEAKWPGVFRTPITTKDGETSRYFKGLITAIEKSNAGFAFNGDENTLKGKMVGFNFGEEEYLSRDGEIRTSVKPFYAVSVGRVRDGIEPPAKKLYQPKPGDELKAKGFTEVDNVPDLPF